MNTTDEPIIIVNGHKLSDAEATTVRVALNTFITDMLGHDEHSKRLESLYLNHVRAILQKMHN